MTIHHMDAFQRAMAAGFDGVFDWDFLLPAFAGTKIAPMDFDAVVERRGHFLCFETKTPGAPIKLGQIYTLNAALRGPWTVFHLEGKTPASLTSLRVHVDSMARGWLVEPVSAECVVAYTRRWFRFACGGHIDGETEEDVRREMQVIAAHGSVAFDLDPF